MGFGSDRGSRKKTLKFNFWFSVVLAAIAVMLGVTGTALLLFTGYLLAMHIIMVRAHIKMMNAEIKAEDELWWQMCLGGRELASKLKVQSLNEEMQAEQQFEDHKTLENMKILQHRKNWHEIVLRAYDRAIKDIERVEDEQKSHLG